MIDEWTKPDIQRWEEAEVMGHHSYRMRDEEGGVS